MTVIMTAGIDELILRANLDERCLVMAKEGLAQTFIRYDVALGNKFQVRGAFNPGELIAWLPENVSDAATRTVTITRLGTEPLVFSELFFFNLPAGKVTLSFGGGGQRLVWLSRGIFSAQIYMFRSSQVSIGQGATSGGVRIFAGNSELIVGKDCMLSDEIILQSTDQHAVVDLSAGVLLNESRSKLVLQPHVWLGRRTMVGKNTVVGAGAIVAAGAVVTKSVPCATAVGGNPAVVVRRNVSWWRYPDKPSDVDRAMLRFVKEAIESAIEVL